jgi:hypothetical protein
MKNSIIFALLISLVLSSCSITQQTYDFYHHGTDSIRTNSNFKYVQTGVMGKAKSTIKMSVWNKMKQDMATDGLLAEAKSNLPSLKNNQAYANMSVDVLHTTKGLPTSGGMNTTEYTIEVVVSCDVIEYY